MQAKRKILTINYFTIPSIMLFSVVIKKSQAQTPIASIFLTNSNNKNPTKNLIQQRIFKNKTLCRRSRVQIWSKLIVFNKFLIANSAQKQFFNNKPFCYFTIPSYLLSHTVLKWSLVQPPTASIFLNKNLLKSARKQIFNNLLLKYLLRPHFKYSTQKVPGSNRDRIIFLTKTSREK